MTHFGPYELQRRLGAGGMAEVFLARRLDGQGGPVCIKRILPSLSSLPGFADMFRDEAALAKRLRSEHIVSVVDDGDVDGVLYIALEYVDGCSLQDAMVRALARRQPPTVPQALELLRQLALALDAAHSAKTEQGQPLGVVHRDVSPQNLLLDRSGTLKLTDFGVARAEERLSRTKTGVIKGKLGYLAPEQVTGDAVDHRADQFAAGVVAWEVLSGRRLFRGPELEVLEAVVSADVAPPSSVRPSIPPRVDAIVVRMLQRCPERRYASMAEVGADVVRLMEAQRDPAWSLLPLVADVDGGTTQRLPRPRFSRDALSSLPAEPPLEATGRWVPAPGPEETTRPDIVAGGPVGAGPSLRDGATNAPKAAPSLGPTLKLEALDPAQLANLQSQKMGPAPVDDHFSNDFIDHEPSTRSRMVRWALATHEPVPRAPSPPPSPPPSPVSSPPPSPPPSPVSSPPPSPPRSSSPPARQRSAVDDDRSALRSSSPSSTSSPDVATARSAAATLTLPQAAAGLLATALVFGAVGVLIGINLDDGTATPLATTSSPALSVPAEPQSPRSVPPAAQLSPTARPLTAPALEEVRAPPTPSPKPTEVLFDPPLAPQAPPPAPQVPPRDIKRSIAAAHTAMLQRDFRTATSLLELVLQREPNNAQAHLSLGIAYSRQRKNSQAATHYRRYLELEPRGPQADMVRDMLEGQARR